MQSIVDTLKGRHFYTETFKKALLLQDPQRRTLFDLARQNRRESFPQEEVEIRSVIEVSNICQEHCDFCNISFLIPQKRYLLTCGDIMRRATFIYGRGRRVLLLQSGENRSPQYINLMCRYLKGIKKRFPDMIMILCFGSLSADQYKQLKDTGAERYILKFETSNPRLYQRIKPADSLKQRLECIDTLDKVGFAVGSGNIVGLPGQTLDDVAADLLFLGTLPLTMASTSVFIPGEGSPYCNEPLGNIGLALNYMALMRILYPRLLIPSTSSLEKAKRMGQYLGLMAGANAVTIHDGTPEKIKKLFPIYSMKRFTPNERRIRAIVHKAGLKFNFGEKQGKGVFSMGGSRIRNA